MCIEEGLLSLKQPLQVVTGGDFPENYRAQTAAAELSTAVCLPTVTDLTQVGRNSTQDVTHRDRCECECVKMSSHTFDCRSGLDVYCT